MTEIHPLLPLLVGWVVGMILVTYIVAIVTFIKLNDVQKELKQQTHALTLRLK